ncbi:MAG TPA: hypothetical protein VEI02_00190, partial [Planctomycetota bacterium]|nr:hypothetical protein [Planctomycetota bacterium]
RVRARVRRAGRGFDVAGAGWSARAGAAVFASGLPSIDDAAAPRSSRRAALRPAVRARFAAGARPLDGVEVHLGRGCEVYLTPLPGGLVNAAALWDVGAVRRGAERDPEDGVAARAAERLLADALDRHPAARDALGPPATPALARAVGERAGRRRVDVGLFHAGDAALAVDPIVGCGVSLALSSGLAAGVAAAAHARGDAAPDASVEHARSVRSAAAGRLRLARFLRYLSTHPAVADAALAVFARTPAVVRALARVGAAARPDAFRR